MTFTGPIIAGMPGMKRTFVDDFEAAWLERRFEQPPDFRVKTHYFRPPPSISLSLD